jgi:hypothetical protein
MGACSSNNHQNSKGNSRKTAKISRDLGVHPIDYNQASSQERNLNLMKKAQILPPIAEASVIYSVSESSSEETETEINKSVIPHGVDLLMNHIVSN